MPTFRDNLHLGRKVPLWGTDDIDNKSVTQAKLGDKSVTLPKLGDDVIGLLSTGSTDMSGYLESIMNETTERINADNAEMMARISAINAEASARASAIEEEKSQREASDTRINNRVNSLDINIQKIGISIQSINEEVSYLKNNMGTDGGVSGLSAEQAEAVQYLVNQLNPLAVTMTGDVSLETGSEYNPSGTYKVTRRGIDITNDDELTIDLYPPGSGSASGGVWTADEVITEDETYGVTATYKGQKATKYIDVKFLPYLYRGEISSVPNDADLITVISGLPKILSDTTNQNTTLLPANKYYLFACKGSITMTIYEATTNGVVTPSKIGTVVMPRVNGSGSDTYSYVIVPSSSINWKFKINYQS